MSREPSYSERLLFLSGNQLTRFSHRRRIAILKRILKEGAPYKLALDYGCADGWILRELAREKILAKGIGVDNDPRMLAAAEEAAQGAFDNLAFFRVQDLLRWCQEGYDLVLCLETLEHVEKPGVLLELFYRCLKPGGRLVVSVPIEVGFPLLVKQVVRFFANLGGSYGYERYTLPELCWGVLGKVEKITSSSHLDPARPYKGHKGFHYQHLENTMRRLFPNLKRRYSPFPFLGASLNATLYLIGIKGEASPGGA